ncbi:hypothetical protein DITRI_Ditri08aG0046500 [Diplodiscus trichospermus]
MKDLVIQLENRDEKSLVLSRFMAIRKVISKKILNRIGVLKILKGIWSIEMAPCIREVGRNLYTISFRSEECLRRAIEKGPSLIMGCSFAMRIWPRGISVMEVMIDEIEFWVQIHNLLLELMTSGNARRIGAKMGRLIMVDEGLVKEGIGRGFLRIRLGIKIEDPLIERFWIPVKDKERRWIMVKYEKLADYCYTCGKLGHQMKSYGSEIKMATHNKIMMKYGEFLRIAPIKNKGIRQWRSGEERRRYGEREDNWRRNMKEDGNRKGGKEKEESMGTGKVDERETR